MDDAEQGFSTLPCQSCHHALYLLPQRSTEIQNLNVKTIHVCFQTERMRLLRQVGTVRT